MSRMPSSAMCSVRGIGVAERDRMSTSARKDLRRSLCLTPKRCSSSTTSRPEVLEGHVLAQQPMRANDDIDLPGDQALDRLAVLLGRAQTGKRAHADRIRCQALREHARVLLGEDLRRHEDRGLAPVRDDLEHGAQRHLGLPEADIAAEQAIHRSLARQVALDGARRDGLIGRVLVGEGGFELALPLAIRGQRSLVPGADAGPASRAVPRPVPRRQLRRACAGPSTPARRSC